MLFAGRDRVMALLAPGPATRLAQAAGSLDHRKIEGRLAQTSPYRPFRPSAPLRSADATLDSAELRLLAAVGDARKEGARLRSAEGDRLSGVALLFAGQDADAAQSLERALKNRTGLASSIVGARQGTDAALLIDLAAAEVAAWARGGDPFLLLIAIEAAERSWRLGHSPEAGWNRALATERLGLVRSAERAWHEYLSVERSPDWRREAEVRLHHLQQSLPASPAQGTPGAQATFASSSLQDAQRSFERELIASNGDRSHLPILEAMAAGITRHSGDRMAADTTAALSQETASPGGLQAYRIAQSQWSDGHQAEAARSFGLAERQLRSAANPFQLVARSQRIRCLCTGGDPHCLEEIRSLQDELRKRDRYPWLMASTNRMEGQSLLNAGRIYEAVKAFDDALREFGRLRDPEGAGWTHMLLANALASAGESDLSLHHQITALQWSQVPTDDRRRQIFEGSALLFLRRDALTAASLVLDELRRSPSQLEGRASELTLTGLLRARQNEPAGASNAFQQVRQLLPQLGPGERERLTAFAQIAEVGSRRYGVPAATIQELDAGIQTYRSSSESVWLPQLLFERGMAWERSGDRAAAERDYLEAISQLELRQPRVDGLLIGAGFTAEAETVFDRTIRLLLGEKRIEDALAIAERANALQISSTFAATSGLHDSYRVGAPGTTGDPRAQAQKLLGPDQHLVVYYLLRDELVTWVVSREDLVFVRKPLHASEWIDKVQRVANPSAAPPSGELDSVSKTLFAPWLDRIPPDATLIFVPPSAFGAIPFSLLQWHGRPLVERNATAVTTSLRAYVDATTHDRQRREGGPALFVSAPRPGRGLPPLPLAASEVLASAHQYAESEVLNDASREQFLAKSPGASIIHFAGHALVNPQQPLLSALVLDRDLIYVHQLLPSSFQRARLIVLSACSTGHQSRPAMSIATALLRQDVPTVVYTLWAISDDAAAEFARRFHEALARGGTRAGAVREAQRLMRNGTAGFRDPSAWGAFQIAGAPGPLGKAQNKEER
ncbi:MAG: CHAT domain-containing protein [Thermoanaerobaculia bacterium]